MDTLKQYQSEVRTAQAGTCFNKTRTAAQLGITFRALRYKLKKLGID